MTGREKIIRDPVHGDIRVDAEDVALLDTPEVQRLRGVKQLGTANHVYPGAQHTRFEHVLGTYHVAGRLVESIRENHRRDPESCLDVGPEDEAVIRAVALLHDVTHIPHGHAIEDQDGLFARHDRRELLGAAARGGKVGEVLRKRGMLEAVADHLFEDAGGPSPYLSQVVNGPLGADMLDYLRRDAYFTGLRLGYDDRVFQYLKIDPQSKQVYVDLVKHDMDREDVLTEVLNLLHARYISSERIYYHHAKVVSGALVSRAVELAVAEGLTRDRVAGAGDEAMLGLLRGWAPEGGPAHTAINALLDRFQSRRLLKRCFVGARKGNEGVQDQVVAVVVENRQERLRLEREIAEVLDVPDPTHVIVYCPRKSMQLKEAAVPVRRAGRGIQPLSAYSPEFPVLRQLVDSYRDLWKLYVLVPFQEESRLREAATKVESVLNRWFPGVVNHYRP